MNNLIYWLYGFKYWVISIEVPGAYTKRDRCKLPETSYKLISWTGVIVNFALCFAIAYQRYYLSLAIANGTANTAKFDTQLNLQLSADGLLAISAIFLADALCRLKHEFSQNAKFVQNRQTMCLHVYVIFGHSLVLIAT
jgi:amino acid permease